MRHLQLSKDTVHHRRRVIPRRWQTYQSQSRESDNETVQTAELRGGMMRRVCPVTASKASLVVQSTPPTWTFHSFVYKIKLVIHLVILVEITSPSFYLTRVLVLLGDKFESKISLKNNEYLFIISHILHNSFDNFLFPHRALPLYPQLTNSKSILEC
jgi:hypothetical protein